MTTILSDATGGWEIDIGAEYIDEITCLLKEFL